MALSRPIGWLRDQRGDAVGLATADPLFQGGETKPTGYVATYSPVFTAEQVQQESKEASMALSKSALKRVIDSVPEGHDVGVWVVRVCRAVEAEVRKSDDALILQPVEPLTPERVKEIVRGAGYDQRGIPDTERAAFINGLRHGEQAHGIKVGQHGTK